MYWQRRPGKTPHRDSAWCKPRTVKPSLVQSLVHCFFSGLIRSCLFVTYRKPETAGKRSKKVTPSGTPETFNLVPRVLSYSLRRAGRREPWQRGWETFRVEDENDYEYEIWFEVFSRIVKKQTPRNSSLYFFSPEKIALLSLLKEVDPSPDCKMLKLLTFDNLFPPLRHSR